MKKACFLFSLFLLLCGSGAQAAELHLEYGLSLALPSGWQVLSKKVDNQLDEFVSDSAQETGPLAPLEIINLLSAHSGALSGGVVVVSAEPQNLANIYRNMLQTLQETAPGQEAPALRVERELLSSGFKKVFYFVEAYPFFISELGGRKALVQSYIYKMAKGDPDTLVEQFCLVFDKYLIRIVFTRNTAQKKLLPAIEFIKKSVSFSLPK